MEVARPGRGGPGQKELGTYSQQPRFSSVNPAQTQFFVNRRTLKIGFLAFFLICMWPATSVLAWNSQGHMVIAQIAYNHLDPQVKAQCDTLLTNVAICGTTSTSFVNSSTWADQRCESWTSVQHYIDLPISLDTSPTNGVAYDPLNVVTAIRQHVATLQNTNATPGDQATALRYLIHFAGDIQQPLHCSTAVWASNLDGDAGGNQFSIGSGNLHAFWDAGGGYLTDGVSVSNKAAAVETAYPYALSIGAIPDPMDWAAEGQEIARTNTYVGVTNGFPVSGSYSNRTQATTVQRMAIGGQRLAKLLNTIFVTDAPTITGVTLTNGNCRMTWSAVSGRSYRVQWKQELNEAAWHDLTNVTSSTNSASMTDGPLQIQRFYRVTVVN